MLDGMYAAAAGMEAQQQQLDAIGNDLANVSTTGYRSQRVGFRDLLYNHIEVSGTATTVGAGAAAQTIGLDQSEGSVQLTGRPLDVAIEGPGFLAVKRPNGTRALTRDGALEVDASGQLTTAEGDLLDPPLTLPKGTSPGEVAIESDGTVRAGAKVVGRLALLTVAAPDRLLPVGSSLFAPTAGSGAPQPAAGATLRQGALEGSNVDLGSEMVAMMSAQRDYQLESAAIQNESQMLAIANQLRA
jgi:flagellar basal-body rod protein FlgG